MAGTAPDRDRSADALAVRFRAGPSSRLILATLATAAVLIGAMFAVFIARRDLSVGRGISLIVFLGVLAAVLGSIHHVRTTEYLVTDRSVVARTGFLEDRKERLAIADVASVEVDQPIHKRLFGMGDVRLEPASPGSQPVRFALVAQPRVVRAHLLSLVAEDPDEDPPAGSASATHSSKGASRV